MTDGPRGGPTPLRRDRVRPSGRAILLLLLGGLLYGAGSNVSSGWLIVLAAVAIGAVPWAAVTAMRAVRTITVQRVLPTRAVAGGQTPVQVLVRASSSAMAVVHDELTGAVGVAAGLRDGVELTGAVRLRRGQMAGGVVRVRLSDPFGLVTVDASGPVPGEGLVLPAIPPTGARPTEAPWALQVGDAASRSGHGSEVVGVREYRHGDPIRAIHWRSTARRGALVVRELAEPSRPRIRIELATGTWPRDALDRACELASAIATDAHDAGIPVAIAVDGADASWSPAARRLLALLPPHAGAQPRPLRPAPEGEAEVTVGLAPGQDGVRVTVRATGGGTVDVGVVPADSDLTQLGAWLRRRLDRQVPA